MADRQSSLFEPIGDFLVAGSTVDKAEDEFADKSHRSQHVDRQNRAPVTTDYNKWEDNPDRWDYPSVDTPTENPSVLPKDLMVSDKPRTTDSETPDDRGVAARYPEEEAGGTMADAFSAEMTGRDVPASPEEVKDGVGAVGPGVLGFNPGVGERRPNDELSGGLGEALGVDESDVKPPETALKRQRFGASKFMDSDNSPEAIADVYEQGDFDISLAQFRRRVKSKKRRSGLPLDMFGAAKQVAAERGAFPAYR